MTDFFIQLIDRLVINPLSLKWSLLKDFPVWNNTFYNFKNYTRENWLLVIFDIHSEK